MYHDILRQYIMVLWQYACHISQYIAIRFWHDRDSPNARPVLNVLMYYSIGSETHFFV